MRLLLHLGPRLWIFGLRGHRHGRREFSQEARRGRRSPQVALRPRVEHGRAPLRVLDVEHGLRRGAGALGVRVTRRRVPQNEGRGAGAGRLGRGRRGGRRRARPRRATSGGPRGVGAGRRRRAHRRSYHVRLDGRGRDRGVGRRRGRRVGRRRRGRRAESRDRRRGAQPAARRGGRPPRRRRRRRRRGRAGRCGGHREPGQGEARGRRRLASVKDAPDAGALAFLPRDSAGRGRGAHDHQQPRADRLGARRRQGDAGGRHDVDQHRELPRAPRVRPRRGRRRRARRVESVSGGGRGRVRRGGDAAVLRVRRVGRGGARGRGGRGLRLRDGLDAHPDGRGGPLWPALLWVELRAVLAERRRRVGAVLDHPRADRVRGALRRGRRRRRRLLGQRVLRRDIFADGGRLLRRRALGRGPRRADAVLVRAARRRGRGGRLRRA
mmetsp:Transcript_27631/g.85347  ORF Transcript_27631/g.85347 Transcript_27631/m.85347 type:complete len:438 (-) Transcript_27631:17-1330(-)